MRVDGICIMVSVMHAFCANVSSFCAGCKSMDGGQHTAFRAAEAIIKSKSLLLIPILYEILKAF